ncbi:hypothetical protein M419DRAFT_130263 [Trichoderma reesei RUT C-30]|nr:hypothetical protein M419DRAFT_130263 [Trichoderma reesei RUT C-30]
MICSRAMIPPVFGMCHCRQHHGLPGILDISKRAILALSSHRDNLYQLEIYPLSSERQSRPSLLS